MLSLAMYSSTRATCLALAPQFGKCGFAIDRLHPPSLEIVVSAIDCGTKLCEFLQIASHRILNQVIGGAPRLLSQFLQAGLGLGWK
jgi:hypothetical protein